MNYDWWKLNDEEELCIMLFRLQDRPYVIGVAKHCIWHSPDGFEWGYHGSGPADLALNILEHFLLEAGFDGPRTEMPVKGSAFDLAIRLHQDFKAEVLADIPRDIPHDDKYFMRWELVKQFLIRNTIP